MSSTNGNGGHAVDDEATADEDTPRDQSWRRGDFSDPEITKRALIEIATWAEEGIKTSRRNSVALQKLREELRVFREELAERHGMIMAALARIERSNLDTTALAHGIAARVARLDQERELPITSIDKVKRELAILKERLGREKIEETKARVKLEEKVEFLSKEQAELDADVEYHKRRTLSGFEKKATALELEVVKARAQSAHDLEEKRDEGLKIAASREDSLAKEKRDDGRAVRMWGLGILGTILVLIAGALIGRHQANQVPKITPAVDK